MIEMEGNWTNTEKERKENKLNYWEYMYIYIQEEALCLPAFQTFIEYSWTLIHTTKLESIERHLGILTTGTLFIHLETNEQSS